jgi:hypothetical protein
MPTLHIILQLQWLLQAQVYTSVKGNSMPEKMYAGNLFNDKNYWPGRCHR